MDMEIINNLVNRRADGEFEHPLMFDEYIASFVEALGDNIEEVIELVENSTKEQQSVMYEAYEEIKEKFPSDNLNDLIIEKCDVVLDKTVDKRWYQKK